MKSLDDLWKEGKITAMQYRSMLWMMKTGYSFSSTPEGAISDHEMDAKIEELTRVIEKEKRDKEGG